MNVQTNEYVAILDAGSQFGKVIDRKIRELKVETRILPLQTPAADLAADPHLKGIIISGAPDSLQNEGAPMCERDIFLLGKPVLGLCYGMQLLVHFMGGEVSRGALREDGQDDITVDLDCPLFAGLAATETVLLTHGDSVVNAGPELTVVGRSTADIIAAVQHRTLPLFGFQFHPEVELSVHGREMFRNFLDVCGCSFSFTMEDREAVALRLIRERTSEGQKVLCLASGGVDSTVCAVLLLKALGPERVVCVHIDHGFMRLNESAAVVEALKEAGVNVTLVDAASQFAEARTEMPVKGGREAYTTRRLCEAVEPEEKRTIIGNTFMSICDEVIKSMNLDVGSLLLAQGTLRPDLIESGSAYASRSADAIKTHHNDTAVVRRLRDAGRIIEPLCDYHKDEVRELGARLGIPRALVERQPFPGPGLAIRVLCSDGEPFTDAAFEETHRIVERVCAGAVPHSVAYSVRDAIVAMGLAACVLPVRTVGVQGDGRTYAYAAALSSGSFPTAAEWERLLLLARAVPKAAHHVNRVVFLFGERRTASPTAVTPAHLVPDVLDKLRAADDVVSRHLLAHGLVRRLSQVPVVLVPVGFERDGGFSIVVRTFITNDFMTGVPALPGSEYMPLEVLEAMVTELQALPFVGRVMYDMTAKPPGTTEWE